MKIIKFGIDARCLEWQRGGVSRVILRMLTYWLNYEDNVRYTLYFQNIIPNDDILKHSKIECKIIKGPKILKKKRILTEQFLMPIALFKEELDIFWAPWYTAPIIMPRVRLIVGAWDISYSTNPSHYKLTDWLTLHFFSKFSCIRADGVLTCSKFDAEQIHHFYHINREKIHYIELNADPKFSSNVLDSDLIRVREKYYLPNKFLLSLGVMYKRRNVDVIIDSVNQLNSNGLAVNLVIVGKNKIHPFTDIEDKISSSIHQNKIKYIKWIDEEDIIPLYKLAYGFICTSTVDGESILLKEAMACKIPVITSKLLSDALGGNCIIIENPMDPTSTSAAISKLFDNDFDRNSYTNQGVKFLSSINVEIEALKAYKFIKE